MTDFTKILDKAKELEAKMKESQEKIKEIKAEGVSGSNSVKITLDGEGEMQKIELSDEIIKEDKTIIEDLIVAAHNSAKSQLKTKTTEEISKATGGKMISNQSKMGTLAAKMKDLKDLDNENIVKVITNKNLNNDEFSQAKNFLRRSPEIANIYHHIGIYCYSAETLKKFVGLKQSKNEIENRLEQLRALDNNIDINVALASSSPNMLY